MLRQGFLSGVNTILVIGAVLAFAGAALALWLMREHEIGRDQPELAAAAQDQLEASASRSFSSSDPRARLAVLSVPLQR
jgi:hypothetical protein